MAITILTGDAREMLATLPDESVDCCVTSPPYFGLRSYLPGDHADKAKEMGLEQTPDDYVAGMVAVFREVRRVLKPQGTLWLNLGDSYAKNPAKGGSVPNGKHDYNPTCGDAKKTVARRSKEGASDGAVGRADSPGHRLGGEGLKPKDLIGIPWMVAFALQADGWWLRQWLPWVKRNPMPESTRDRPTTACETVFMMTKSERYFFDYEAVRRRMVEASVARLAQDINAQAGSARANGGAKTNGTMKAVRGDKQRGHSRRHGGLGCICASRHRPRDVRDEINTCASTPNKMGSLNASVKGPTI